MKITWFGRACFEIVTAGGAVILTDPYHPATGYTAHPVRADIVTVSHEHGDHNCKDWIQGSPEIIRGEGRRTVKGVAVTGLKSFHDGAGGAQRGPNTVFLIESDGLRLCHLGDLGHEPDGELYEAIGKPDVLFVPAGGYFTVEPETAAAIARRIGAVLTIPMHFRAIAKDAPVGTVDAFARATGAERINGCTITIEANASGPRTAVLDYLR